MSRLLGKRNSIVDNFVKLTPFTNTTDWTLAGTNSSYVNSSTITKNASVSLRLRCSSTGAGQFAQIQRELTAFPLTPNARWDFWVYVPDYTKLDSTNGIQLLVATSGLTKSYSAIYKPDYNGWHCIRVLDSTPASLAAGHVWSVAGGANWAVDTFNTFRFRVYAATDQVADVYFDSCYCVGRERAKLVISVDDGHESLFNAALTPSSPYAYIRAAGLPLTHYLIGALIDTTGYLTSANLNTLYTDGDDFGVHGELSLASLASAPARESDIRTNRNFLVNRGFTRGIEHYAYPNGVFEISADGGNSLFPVLTSLGFKTGRVAARRAVNPQSPSLSRAFALTILGHSQTTDTTTVMKNNLAALVKMGGLGVTMFHQWIQSGSAQDIQCNMADWTSFIDEVVRLKKLGLLDVVTMSQLYQQISSGRQVA